MATRSYAEAFSHPDGAPSPPAFQFITSSGPPGQLLTDRESIKRIKSHVMRRYQHSKRKYKKKEAKELTELRGKEASADHRSTRRLSQLNSMVPSEKRTVDIIHQPFINDERAAAMFLEMVCNFASSALPIEPTGQHSTPGQHPYYILLGWLLSKLARNPLDSGTLDPFDSLPVPKSPESSLLVTWCEFTCPANTDVVLILRYTQVATGFQAVLPCPTKQWPRHLFSNPGTMHCLLSLLARDYMGLVGQTAALQVEYYRMEMETVRLINESLSDPKMRYNDEVILAVALYASNEVKRGNAEAAKVHFSALQGMIKKRGGLQALGMDGLLARVVYWIDTIGAWFSLSAPYLQATVCIDEGTRGQAMGIIIDTSPKDEIQIRGPSVFGIAAASSLLRQLSLENQCRSALTLDNDLQHYSDRITALEGQLTALVHYRRSEDRGLDQLSPLEAVEQSFYIASLLYLHQFLRELPGHWSIFGRVLRRLRECMMLFVSTSDFKGLEAQSTDQTFSAVFWTLFVGGVSARSGPEGLWYQGKIREMCVQLDLQSWEATRDQLGVVAWVERSCLKRWRLVWEESMGRFGQQDNEFGSDRTTYFQG